MENSQPAPDASGSSRDAVLRLVAAQSAPVSIAAIAMAVGLHENTVRGHLERLRDDGLVARQLARVSGRGRPAWLWVAVDRAADNEYATLATVLADTIAQGVPDPTVHARSAGRAWGAQLAGRYPGASGRESVVGAMAAHGFAPEDDGRVITLRRCPLLEAASRQPEVICAVHQGMIDEILAAQGDPEVSELTPFTAPGECTLVLRSAG